MQTENHNLTERPPVVAIMGHIDHGKSTLLSYIRKSTKPLNEAGRRHAGAGFDLAEAGRRHAGAGFDLAEAGRRHAGAGFDLAEAGGITQHISAYEVEHVSKEGKSQSVTFLDTPGHEAFSGIRARGASVADIAVLVVSAEDGVKTQTLEALKVITESKTPFIVVINKIDKEGANIERTKQNLAENGIYIEGFGGDVPAVCLSAKTGEGVSELFDMIMLVAEINAFTGNPSVPAEGVVIESNRDIKKGISATCIIKNGTMEKGMFVTSGISTAPVRIMENYLGKSIDKATFSSPVRIIGWDIIPEVGNTFRAHKNRDDARVQIEKEIETKESIRKTDGENKAESEKDMVVKKILIIVKADTGSSLEAVVSEIKKLNTEQVETQIISSSIGTISENDIRLANGKNKAMVIGFNTKIDSPAKNLAKRSEIEIKLFDIIYKMSEWLKEALIKQTPKTQVLESTGRAKILKIFSKVKDKQILGGRVEKGLIALGVQIKIFRRDIEIGDGKIRELQQQKIKTSEVKEGTEFGVLIEAKMEISVGDYIESFIIIEK